MPPPQAEPIISGYHCDVMETFGDPSNVMKDPGVVDGENAMIVFFLPSCAIFSCRCSLC